MSEVRAANYREDIETSLQATEALDIGVAFATVSGLRFGHIERHMESLILRGARVRILVDLRLGNTDPEFLEEIVQWRNQHSNLECRAYLGEGDAIFHAKLYLFHLQDGTELLISGSANWTGAAYSANIEHGIAVKGSPDEPIIASARASFDQWWRSRDAKPIDAEVVRLYRNYWRRRRGLEAKTRQRTSAGWRQVRNRLEAAAEPLGFQWPSGDAAFLLGLLAARGAIDTNTRRLSMTFRYGARNYQKGTVNFERSQVAQLVPQFVANRLANVVAPESLAVERIGQWTYALRINCEPYPHLLNELRQFFGAATDYRHFAIPQQVFNISRDNQEEFLRGYGLACGLVSSGTYDPTMHHQVWLRPATENVAQFDQLVDLLQRSLGVAVYRHRRASRDVAVKIRCEAWLDIGFGIDWLDTIVEEGARLNGALA